MYVIFQFITSAYGLAVIESVTPLVEKKLKDKGYTKNKNSLYNFNSTVTDILKVFVPFYYLGKSISIISNRDSSIDKKVESEIKKGRYINEEDLPDVQIIEEEKTEVLDVQEPEIAFEKAEKYKARKNTDIDSLYNTYETPLDYRERIATNEDKLELTPFINNDKVVEHVVVKPTVSKADIAKAITELSSPEIESLINKLNDLVVIKKRNNKLLLEKDVA